MKFFPTLSAALAACAILASTVAPATDDPPNVRLTVGQLIPISPYGACPIVGDLEGVFGPNQMVDYLSCVVPDVDRWFGVFYPGLPHPSGYYYVPAGYQFDTACSDAVTPDSLGYCRLDRAVYLGADAIWTQYSVFGDGAPVTVIAHEVTHHIQNMRNMPTSQTPNQQIRYENQADCGAGAFMAYSRNQGRLSTNDIRDLAGSLSHASQREGPGRDHGTMAERLQSFDLSYLSLLPVPLWACNPFVPEIALLP